MLWIQNPLVFVNDASINLSKKLQQVRAQLWGVTRVYVPQLSSPPAVPATQNPCEGARHSLSPHTVPVPAARQSPFQLLRVKWQLDKQNL